MATKKVVITGAAGALGTALCHAFKEEGFSVIGTDKVRPESAPCDAFIDLDLDSFVKDEERRSRGIADIVEKIGGSGLDALVNNAAVQIVEPVRDLTVDSWRESLNVNLLAPFLLIQALLPYLEAAKGSIVNVGSIHSKLTKPRFSCYATTKAALSGLTRTLAVELGSTVRINEIAPAAIATPMLIAGFGGRREALEQLAEAPPLGRIASAEEVSRGAVFLVSESASFMTGASMQIDGGIGARLHDPE